MPPVKYAMDYRPADSFSMSSLWGKVIFPGVIALSFSTSLGSCGMGMNIRQETTYLSGVKDGNENTKGFESIGKKGKMGMRVLKRF